ncbi:ribonuclease domain-containing protein [Luedemannella flava]|uniref:ribonuclease domain-containing protein n=1 Tax=Luedemannella flava TaxID=349316 RepID=UPI0031E0B5CC
MAGRRAWIGVAAAAVVVLGLLMLRGGGGGDNNAGPSVTMPTASGTPRSSLPPMEYYELPAEAQDTLGLIERGGPYPDREDGSEFRNYEHRLPNQEEGYYREFTVETPDEPGRGARRLVVGRAGDVYYTEDHYLTFRQVML